MSQLDQLSAVWDARKFTLSPWVVGSQSTFDGCNLFSDGTNSVVAWFAPATNADGAFVANKESGDLKDNPDARLAAAAPRLAEELNSVCEWALATIGQLGATSRAEAEHRIEHAISALRVAIVGGEEYL